MAYLSSGPLPTLATYLLAALSMRWFSLTRSVIDWDETTYLLGARALTEGKSMYVDFWDFKPPGIFWLLSGLEFLFEDSVLPLRIVGLVVITLTGFIISRISLALSPENKLAAFFAGFFFISAISFNGFSNAIARGYGLEINTEHFFLFFSCLAFYLVVKYPRKIAIHGLAGVVAGLGLVIKYFVLVDVVVMAYAIVLLNQSKEKWDCLSLPKARQCLSIFVAGIGLLTPFGLTVAWFYFFSGHWSEFSAVTFESGASYSTSFSLSGAFKFWGDFFYLSGILSLCLLAVFWYGFGPAKAWRKHRGLVLYFVWFWMVLIAIALPGKFFIHYLYQAFPPLALLAAQLFTPQLLPVKKLRESWVVGIATVLLISIPVVDFLKIQARFGQPDTPREIATYLDNHSDPDRPIYIYNYYHVIYYLTNRLPPTPYYHPSVLFNNAHSFAAGIDQVEEWDKILIQNPEYIIINSRNGGTSFPNRIKEQWKLETTFADGIDVYRKDEPELDVLN